MGLHRGGLSRTDALLVRAAVFASAGAGALHLGAVHPHMQEWPPAALFMLVAGIAQLAWIAWVANDASRTKVFAGLAGNAGVIALWVVTRTIGLPFGPMPGVAEHAHAPDLIATGLEAIVVGALAGLIFDRAPRPARRLMMLAVAGLILSVVASAHEPARERLTALATLGAVGVAAAVSLSFSLSYVSAHVRRRNEYGSPARSRSGAVEHARGAAVVARG
ncbi:MAG TPA: hypothetical protein VGB64_00370 [Actinomycetota bacterium]